MFSIEYLPLILGAYAFFFVTPKLLWLLRSDVPRSGLLTELGVWNRPTLLSKKHPILFWLTVADIVLLSPASIVSLIALSQTWSPWATILLIFFAIQSATLTSTIILSHKKQEVI